MKTIGYARVSKREQAENSHALEQQQARLKAAGAEEIYTDILSGTKDRRPAFHQVMELVKSQAVDAVIVTRIDRLGRSMIACRKALDEFRSTGVALKVLDGSIDLSTVGGRTQANIMAVLAEMEAEMISERSKHGWAYLRSRRVAVNMPFGYIKRDDRHCLDTAPFLCLLETQEERTRAQIARETIELFLEVESLRQTVIQLNRKYGVLNFNHTGSKSGFTAGGLFRWSPSGLKLWLTSPVLCGHLSYLDGKEIHYNTHPDQVLTTEQEQQAIQGVLDRNREHRGFGARSKKYPLSGLIKCGECGGTHYYNRGGPSRRDNRPARAYGYYQCKNAFMGACPVKQRTRAEVLEAAVIEALIDRAESIATIAQTPLEQPEPPELQALRAELAYYEAAPGARAAGIVADLKHQIENFQYEKQVDDSRLVDQRELLAVCADRLYWQTLLDSEKREIFRALVDRVEVRVIEGERSIEVRLKV